MSRAGCAAVAASNATIAPKEKPASVNGASPQRCRPQAMMASASSVSPLPSSYCPSLCPTPRKLKRSVGRPCSCRLRATVCTTLLVIVPP